MDLAAAALVAGAGFAAGAVNAVAGGGTLIAFPAVMATGNSALVANMTTGTGLLSGYAGGSLAYRAELGGQRGRVRSLAAVALVGAVIGAVILLRTPNDTFRTVVPYLVLLSCALLAAQPAVARLVARRAAEESHSKELNGVAQFGVLLGAVYGTYFGAGLGVILLAILGIVLDDSLHRLNALKGVLAFIINLTGVSIFVLSGNVVWSIAAILAVTAVLGAHVGVSAARKLPGQTLRWVVVAFGSAYSILLIVRG